MTRVEAGTFINAQKADIWSFITAPANFAKYIDDYEAGEFLTPHEKGLGATFRWYTVFWGRRISSTESTVKWVENEQVEYEGKMAGAWFHSQMALEDAGAGRTKFQVTIDYKIPYSLLGKILDLCYFHRRIRHDVSKSILAVKNHFEKN